MTFTNKKSEAKIIEALPSNAKLACKLADCTLTGERFVVAIETASHHGEWVSIPADMKAVMQASVREHRVWVRPTKPEMVRS
jgi:hypothetical protein